MYELLSVINLISFGQIYIEPRTTIIGTNWETCVNNKSLLTIRSLCKYLVFNQLKFSISMSHTIYVLYTIKNNHYVFSAPIH